VRIVSSRIIAIVLAVAAATGLLFAIFPELDLAISARYFDPSLPGFPLRSSAWVQNARDFAELILIALVAPAVIVLLVKFFIPRRSMPISGRAALFLIVTLVLGPGLLVNSVLKEHWSRPRPVAVTQFNGTQQFVPWWNPTGDCRRNCSFVSGEGSSAFWTIAPAVLAPPSWRAATVTAAIAYGIVMSGLRLAVGAHFFTDLVFAAVFTFLIIWLVHAWLYRRSAQSADDPVERTIERMSNAVRRLGRRVSGG
jgi:membrane-associated PAP2 superfamily phosphatase